MSTSAMMIKIRMLALSWLFLMLSESTEVTLNWNTTTSQPSIPTFNNQPIDGGAQVGIPTCVVTATTVVTSTKSSFKTSTSVETSTVTVIVTTTETVWTFVTVQVSTLEASFAPMSGKTSHTEKSHAFGRGASIFYGGNRPHVARTSTARPASEKSQTKIASQTLSVPNSIQMEPTESSPSTSPMACLTTLTTVSTKTVITTTKGSVQLGETRTSELTKTETKTSKTTMTITTSVRDTRPSDSSPPQTQTPPPRQPHFPELSDHKDVPSQTDDPQGRTTSVPSASSFQIGTFAPQAPTPNHPDPTSSPTPVLHLPNGDVLLPGSATTISSNVISLPASPSFIQINDKTYPLPAPTNFYSPSSSSPGVPPNLSPSEETSFRISTSPLPISQLSMLLGSGGKPPSQISLTLPDGHILSIPISSPSSGSSIAGYEYKGHKISLSYNPASGAVELLIDSQRVTSFFPILASTKFGENAATFSIESVLGGFIKLPDGEVALFSTISATAKTTSAGSELNVLEFGGAQLVMKDGVVMIVRKNGSHGGEETKTTSRLAFPSESAKSTFVSGLSTSTNSTLQTPTGGISLATAVRGDGVRTMECGWVGLITMFVPLGVFLSVGLWN